MIVSRLMPFPTCYTPHRFSAKWISWLMTSVENPCWVGCQTYIYSMPLWAQDLMVTYPATVLQKHPYTVLLTWVHTLDTILSAKDFQIQTGEGLVRTVILRTHKAVELPVVHRGQAFLKGVRLLFQPFSEPVADLALASCMPSLSRTLMSLPCSSSPMLFIMSGQVLCRACFRRLMPS